MSKIKVILYIGILFLNFITNVKTKTFQDSIKKVLWSRKATSFLQEDVESLKDILKPFFKIGTFINPFELTDGSEFIIKHFNSLTPENELKPEAIINLQACQSEGNNVNTQVYFSSGTTKILKFCEDNGIPLHGHTFVWYSQTPSWFFKEDFNPSGNLVTTDIMDQRLESFIKNTFDLLAKNFPKLEIYAYDVANEIFINDGGGMRGADTSDWVKVYGDDSFIIKAFIYARKYAPKGCKLFINDYNEYIPAKTNDIYNMAIKLKEQGILDGIGMQSHLDVSYPSFSIYKTALEKFILTGLEIQITEFEITTNNDSSSQIELFKDIFQLFVDNADKISSVTFWNTNNYNWRRNNLLLFDHAYQPKEGYYVILEIAKAASIQKNDKKKFEIDES